MVMLKPRRILRKIRKKILQIYGKGNKLKENFMERYKEREANRNNVNKL